MAPPEEPSLTRKPEMEASLDDVMSAALISGLIGVFGTLLGVAVSGMFALVRDRKQEQHERESFRTLLSLELLQNSTALNVLHEALESALHYDDSVHIATAFFITAVPPQWEKARWNALEAGKHLNPSELLRIGEWYTKLDGASFLFERLMEQLRHHPFSDGKFAITPEVADHTVVQIRDLVEYVQDLQVNPPPLPDSKLNSGESVREYLNDLQRRHPDAIRRPEHGDPQGATRTPGDAGG